MDYFMRGKQANGEDVGLSTIPGYALRSSAFGLPLSRPRIYFVGVETTDAVHGFHTGNTEDMILHVLTTLFQDAYLGVEPDAGYFLEWLDDIDTNFPKQENPKPRYAKCDQCDQLFGQYDRYAKETQVTIRCSKMKLNVATGEKEPDGHECFACEKVRGRKFGAMKATELKKMREIDQKFDEHRSCAALPGARLPKEGFDISAFQEQAAYADKYIEAYWLPIDSFINEEDTGIMGDLEAWEEVYEQASGSMQSLADQVGSIDNVRQRLALKADDSDAADSLIEALPAPSESKELRMRFGLFDGPGSDQGQPPAINPKGSGRSKPVKNLAPTSSNPAEGSKRQRKALGADGNTRPPPADSSAPAPGPNKTTKTLELMRKAREVLQKQDVAFSDNSIWGSKLRKRALDAAVKSLSSQAALLLATNDTDAINLSTQLNEWCDHAEIRFEALQAVRNKPLEVAGAASEEMAVHMETLKNMQVPMLSNIILHVAGECLKSLDKEATQVQGTERFFTVASCKMDTGLTVGSVFSAAQRNEHRDAPDMPASLAANLQTQLVALWYDRIMRMKNAERFRQLINACPVPRLELYRLAADWKPPKQDIDGSSGKCFSTTIRFDIQVLRLMSMQDWQQASPIEVLVAKTAVDLRPQLSMRLQTFMRSGTGSAGKQLINKTSYSQLWALMEQASKRALSPASVATEVNGAADELPQDALDVAVQTSSIIPLLEEDMMCFCEHRLLIVDPAAKLDRAIAASESLKVMPQVPEVSADKAAALKQVLPAAEQLFVCTEGLLGEILVAHSSVMDAFKKLAPETFAVAVRAMNKLACSSRVADLKLQITRVSEGPAATGPNEAAGQLCKAAQRLVDLLDQSHRQDLQVTWLKELLGKDMRSELEKLDASVFHILDTRAGKLWRSVQIVQDATRQEAEVDETGLSRQPGPLDLEKEAVVKTALHFTQMHTIDLEELSEAGLHDVHKYQDRARAQLAWIMKGLTAEMCKAKDDIKKYYEDYNGIVACVETWDDDKIKAILAKVPEASNAKASMDNMLDGAGRMYQTEVGAEAITTWADQPLLQKHLETDWGLLKQARNAPPRAADCFKVAAYMMA
ncbi:unnamed protein product, partial [Symbiodinium sp. CCMP2456]